MKIKTKALGPTDCMTIETKALCPKIVLNSLVTSLLKINVSCILHHSNVVRGPGNMPNKLHIHFSSC